MDDPRNNIVIFSITITKKTMCEDQYHQCMTLFQTNCLAKIIIVHNAPITTLCTGQLLSEDGCTYFHVMQYLSF